MSEVQGSFLRRATYTPDKRKSQMKEIEKLVEVPSEPIMAMVIETPQPPRPRLYVMLSRRYSDDTPSKGWAVATPAKPTLEELMDHYPPDGFEQIAVCIPGSDEAWTEERVRIEARKFWQSAALSSYSNTETLVRFAEFLGVFVSEKKT